MNARAKSKEQDPSPDDYGVVTAPDTVRLRRLLPGPIERVWAYLTDSRKRGEWLASGDMDLKVGGRVEHLFNNGELTGHDDRPPAKYEKYAGPSTMIGKITACDAPRLLAYTWPEESGVESQVMFELSVHGKEVLLVLTHSRLANRDEMIGVAAGWHAHVGILIDRLRGRRPQSFWPTHTRLEAEYEERIPPQP